MNDKIEALEKIIYEVSSEHLNKYNKIKTPLLAQAIATYITENYIPRDEKVKNIPLHKRLGQIIKQLKKEGYSVDEIMAKNGRVFTMGTEDK